MTHPETFTNKKIISKHGNSFPSRTKTLSKVVTQGLRHITQKKSIESNIGDQILNEMKDSPGYMAVVEAMKAVHERNRERYENGVGGFQLYAIEELKEMGWEGVDGKEALSFYMTELYRGGESPLQNFWRKMCKKKGYTNADGSEPSAEEAKRVYEENKAYDKHLLKIKTFAKEKKFIVTLKDSRKVLVIPNKGEYKQTYEYLAGLRRAYGDNDIWQWDRLFK